MSGLPLAAPAGVDDVTSLEATALSHRYGGREALSDVSFRAGGAGLILILGRNGSGKSTLLRLLAGLIPAQAGEVRLDGRPVGAVASGERARLLAWLPQHAAAVPIGPVFDFVLGGRYPYLRRFSPVGPADREAARSALDRLRIGALADRPIHSLSGGERQLVRIARALAQQTPILLLDEPFGALDLAHRANLGRELTTAGRITVAVTHDLSLIGSGCRRVILLDRGRVRADGPPEEVLTREHLRDGFDWTPPDGWVFKPFEF
jgi:iron complex transport system ATP-binding protein